MRARSITVAAVITVTTLGLAVPCGLSSFANSMDRGQSGALTPTSKALATSPRSGDAQRAPTASSAVPAPGEAPSSSSATSSSDEMVAPTTTPLQARSGTEEEVHRIAATGQSTRSNVAHALRACYFDVQNGGERVVRQPAGWLYGAAAGRPLARSETIWGRTSSECDRYVRGQHLVYSFDVNTSLGATDPSVWQVISQLQGPTKNGTWPGPPFALVIESGNWQIAGGYDVPDGHGGYRHDLGFTKTVSPVRSGVWQHWQFDVLLGPPGRGAISATLDGRVVLAAFHPRAGTMYSVGGGYDHAYLQIKTGLYTGTGVVADAPGKKRSLTVRNVTLRSLTQG